MSKSYVHKIQEEETIQKANGKLVEKLNEDYGKIWSSYRYDYKETPSGLFTSGVTNEALQKLETKFEASIYEGITQYFKDLGLKLEVNPENISAFGNKQELINNIASDKEKCKNGLQNLKKFHPDVNQNTVSVNPEIIKISNDMRELEAQIKGLDLLLQNDKLLTSISDSVKGISECAKEGAKSVERLRIVSTKDRRNMLEEEKKERGRFIKGVVKIIAGFVTVTSSVIMIGFSPLFPPLAIPGVAVAIIGATLAFKGIVEIIDIEKRETAPVSKNQKDMLDKVEKMSEKLKKDSKDIVYNEEEVAPTKGAAASRTPVTKVSSGAPKKVKQKVVFKKAEGSNQKTPTAPGTSANARSKNQPPVPTQVLKEGNVLKAPAAPQKTKSQNKPGEGKEVSSREKNKGTSVELKASAAPAKVALLGKSPLSTRGSPRGLLNTVGTLRKGGEKLKNMTQDLRKGS